MDSYNNFSAGTSADASADTSARIESTAIRPQQSPTGVLSWWTLKNKATLLAVALGTLPVLIIGGISTAIASKQLSAEVIGQQQQLTNAIALQLQDFGSQQQSSTDIAQFTEDSLVERILNDSKVDDLSTLVNQRIDSLRQGTAGEGNTLRLNVIDERRNSVLISNDSADINASIDSRFPEYAGLQANEISATFKAVSEEDNQPYLVTYAPVTNISSLNNDLGVLVYQPMGEVFAAQQSLVLTLLAGTILTALLVSTLAAYLANRATQPIIAASRAVKTLGQGQFNTRLAVQGTDELAVLNSNINVMAEQLEYQLEFIQDTAQRQNIFQMQATLVEQHQQQRESTQLALAKLIQSAEAVAKGDFTVQAEEKIDGPVGKLASLFNALSESLCSVTMQAQATTSQIDTATQDHQNAAQKLSEDAKVQAQRVSLLLPEATQLSAALGDIEAEAQQTQAVSQRVCAIAQSSTQTMQASSDSIDGLHTHFTEATRQANQLNAAAQQISQMISLINETALKTNMLAINASIEANPSHKGSAALKELAAKISQLSEQSTRSTGEIERIVQTIQTSSKQIVSTMDEGTAQMAAGASGLNQNKENLSEILTASTEIDRLLQSMADATAAQTVTSHGMADMMTQIKTASEQTVAFSTRDALHSAALIAPAPAAAVELSKVDQNPEITEVTKT